MRALAGHGFVLHKFLSTVSVPLRGTLQKAVPVSGLRNQLVDGDAVFLRPVSPNSDMPDEALKHLALLAAYVFDSTDVTLRCLDVLLARKAVDPSAVERWMEQLPS